MARPNRMASAGRARHPSAYAPHGLRMRGLASEQVNTTLAQALLRLKGIESSTIARKIEPPPLSPLDYAERYRRIDDQPFSLANYAPLAALYADDSPTICVMKPSQRGVSEWAITYALFVLDVGARAYGLPKAGLNVGYFFPSKSDLGDFSKERIAALKHEHEHLTRLFEDSPYDDIGFKQVGSSYLYLRGGHSKTGLRSFSADMIVRDEYDEIERESRELAEKRMNASLFKRLVDISTPTLPGLGIHERFLQSDQHVYLQCCPHCGGENQYDLFRDVTVGGERFDRWQHRSPQQIRRSTVALTCPRCEADLDRAARCRPGRWEAQQPDVLGLRGYHIPALAFPFVDLLELAVKAVNPDPSAIEQFMRQDLGVPYHSAGSGITEEMLVPLSLGLENGRLPAGPFTRVTAGVDIGSRLHVKIMGRKPGEPKPYVLAMVAVGSWAELDNLMERYAVQMCVVDAYPEQHEAAAFVARHRGRAVVGDYPTNMSALKGTLFAPDAKRAVADGFVRINRTMALDAVMTTIAAQKEHWPTAIVNDPEVRNHMTAAVRLTSLSSQGQVMASWVRLRADHYLHASVYCYLADQLFPRLTRPGRVMQAAAKAVMPSGTNYRARIMRIG